MSREADDILEKFAERTRLQQFVTSCFSVVQGGLLPVFTYQSALSFILSCFQRPRFGSLKLCHMGQIEFRFSTVFLSSLPVFPS